MAEDLDIFHDLELITSDYFKKQLGRLRRLFGGRVIDVLIHMPSYTIEKTYSDSLLKDQIGKIVTTKLKVEYIDASNNLRKPIVVCCRSGTSMVEVLLFNYKKYYIHSAYKLGSEVFVSGKLGETAGGIFQFINPEKLTNPSSTKLKTGLHNIYPLTSGISQYGVYLFVNSALNLIKNSKLAEWIPDDIVSQNNFPSFYEALKEIHQPKLRVEIQLSSVSRRRLCFDELLAEQITIRLSKAKTKTGYIIKNEKKLINKLLEFLPFTLTNSQQKAIDEIFKDLESGKPMTRLLQGDVGSGKTIIAVMTALYAIESGYQCAILAPTEILARQHFTTISGYFYTIGIKVELLTANEKGKCRKEILANIMNGTSMILIGTHAIITEAVQFNNLGLVIIDEQHRFGVNQRLQLITKGSSPHVLSMTATPIPRTVIMSIYGDIDVSSITEKPAGRKEIITRVLPMTKIPAVIESIRSILCKGEKVYWVCPLIEESEKLDYTCVINRYNYLKSLFEDNVDILHSKMKTADKQATFEKFKNGDCHILVSTTVIEVGVDIQNASVIIVENAERFGLAQLHQLRGRVGRSDLQSYCLLLYDYNISEIARKRLNIMKASNDGFVIAEQDLLLRGGGEIFGTKQSGQKVYRTFDMNSPDNQPHILDLMHQASTLATRIIENGSVHSYKTLLKIFANQNSECLKQSF
ncbi:MAG: ATP-dependent DNA helicase RecG [Holosporales bacterium]|jgi:ATP-dependent DNA helicase RecG|nr:ATP-dependent DNA helicase RecG [Holosporales bacterium]